MGQKPLYYAETPSGGFVGSEPKALLTHPELGRRLDPDSLARYLFYEYIPAPHSIWAGIKKLPRAHLLIWEDGTTRIERYWSPTFIPWSGVRDRTPPIDDVAEEFWEKLYGAVGTHLRADVPIGVFLSGGVDSSSVARAVARSCRRRVRTFSIGFDDPRFDESMRIVAEYLGDHRRRKFSAETVMELLPEVAGWLDEPFGDASILPTHLLSQFAREEEAVTVAVGGDGADELLAGYPTFSAERAAGLFRQLPSPARARPVLRRSARLPVDRGNLEL